MKSSEEIRKAFLDFWQQSPRNAKIVPNASLVPNNDPTLLFVNSGMFPLVPYLGGQPHPLGKRLCNVQKCIRTIDIEEVGDYNHLTLFEMIGNWSLGDFSKADQIPWKLELYVDYFGLDPNRIYASVWAGDATVPRDEEAIEIWKNAFRKYGIEAEFSEDITNVPQGNTPSTKDWKYRIFPYGKEDNWWQRGPDTPGELGGPTSEIFYDMGEPIYDTKQRLHINDDSGRYLEVGNSVFMEYKFGEDKKWHEMEQKNIDYGGGLDRIVATVQGKRSVYETDLFEDYIKKIEELSGKKYNPKDQKDPQTIAFRVISEHARSSTFIIADGVKPSNKDQGYILRRLIRRMIRFGKKLGIDEEFTKILSSEVIEKMKAPYPHLEENKEKILEIIDKEEKNFRTTIAKGLREMNKMISSREELDGKKAFYIYETYGFPIEMTLEEFNLTQERIDEIHKEFDEEKRIHQEKSRSGAQKKFAGGLADHSDEVIKLHTTHHLLLRSLQLVVDENIKQRGSNITGERLRIDFNFDRKLSEEEVAKVEDMVNEKIKEKLNMVRVEMPSSEAEKLGAEMEFGQKYPDTVSVYFLTEEHAESIPSDWFSAEFCGGPHVKNTSEIGEGGKRFKIKKQKKIGSGIMRIKAVLV